MPKILILEDDPDTLDALCEFFQEVAYEVVPCAAPDVALAEVQSGPSPDIILADTVMTGNGRGFAASLRADPILSRIPMLLMSASSDMSAEHAEHVGAVGFIRKPFDTDALLKLVSQFIRK